MRTRIRILNITDHITCIDCDYEIINKSGERDTIAGTLTEHNINVMYWDKRPKISIAKEHMNKVGYVCER